MMVFYPSSKPSSVEWQMFLDTFFVELQHGQSRPRMKCSTVNKSTMLLVQKTTCGIMQSTLWNSMVTRCSELKCAKPKAKKKKWETSPNGLRIAQVTKSVTFVTLCSEPALILTLWWLHWSEGNHNLTLRIWRRPAHPI